MSRYLDWYLLDGIVGQLLHLILSEVIDKVLLGSSGLNLRALVQLSQELLHIIKELVQVATSLISIVHYLLINLIWKKCRAELNKRPEIQTAQTQDNPNYPQYMVDVDVAKISDTPGKGMCKNPEYVEYLQRCISWRMETCADEYNSYFIMNK